jgi:O-antigen ligase
LGVVGYLVIANAILATQSRGGLLAIVGGSGGFSMYRIKSKLMIMILGAVALLALLAMAGISDRSSGGASESGIDESAQGRLYAWEAAFNMANTHPLTGVGLNNFTSNYFFYSPHWDGMNHAVHSTWFGVMAETGYLGLAVFLTLAIKLVISMRRLVNGLLPLYQAGQCSAVLFSTAQATLAGLAGFMVSGTCLTQGFTWPLYILLAVSVAVSTAGNRIIQQQKEM